jgi:hypothetical protein
MGVLGESVTVLKGSGRTALPHRTNTMNGADGAPTLVHDARWIDLDAVDCSVFNRLTMSHPHPVLEPLHSWP